jgi:hypothetical protein
MTPGRIPDRIRSYALDSALLRRTEELLRHSGDKGFEAVVLWTGTVGPDGAAALRAAVRPGQVAYRSDDGCAVEVPPDEIAKVVSSLTEDEVVLARVHTHPDEAYHSTTDDQNMIIAHVGAISVVVPRFARAPIDLAGCSVNELCPDGTWRELPPAEVRDRFPVLP